MTLPDRGFAGEAAEPAFDLTPDPSLNPDDSNRERVILYHLQHTKDLEVTGPDAQSVMRRELDIDHLSWQRVRADLGARGVLRQARGHRTSLDLKHLLGAADRPFVTPRLLGAVEERQPGFNEETNQLRALRQKPAEVEPPRPTGRPAPARQPAKPPARHAPAPAKADTPAAYSDAERQRARDIVGLYRKLSRIAEVPLPADAIHRLIEPLDRWEYTTEGVNPQVHYLTRQALGSSVKLKLSEPSTPVRSVHKDKESIAIRVEGEPLRGRDLMTLLKIESQYPRHLVRQEMEDRQTARPPRNETADEFRETKDVYLQDGDVLTDRQTVVLGNMARHNSQGQLVDALETTPAALNEVLRPLRARAGIEYNPGNPDSYIQLTLIALALKVADVDHLPKASKREIDNLKEADLELLSKYYSFDPAERAAVREGKSDTSISLMWSRLYRRIGIGGRDSRHQAMLYAVRNDILQLPDASAIKEMLG